ncbi:hypothetical protein [Mycobacterium sp. 94-17]|uniref:tetratricopeptide repeat protein n=1 Tax=Mycobacterium sp. 94-17 TaxID=2986147 RepID=UPI002D1F0B31|nr:hypothetical protein [Mycobacterium sp. 94-17]MEB4208757.1 hypothetical protein [Mycobacterium sp. 94-17]
MSGREPEIRKEQLLYRALADFSDACDVPNLTPSCPFYQLQPDGSPICGEECKDILSDDLSHAVQPNTLTLGGDLAAIQGPRRPRPRRVPAVGRIAFDARQFYLTERDRDVNSWGMTSLIKGLQFQLAYMSVDPNDPPDMERVNEIYDELRNRGIDAVAVTRQGLFRHITTSVLWHIHNVLAKGEDELGWINLIRDVTPNFDETGSDVEDGLERAVDTIRPHLTTWVLFADIEDLIEHRLTVSAEELERLYAEGLPPRDFDAVWLVERFTETYLDDWSRRSLQREWRYIHSQCASPCPPANMRERSVEVKALALLLAEVGARHVEGQDADTDDAGGDGPAGLLHVGQFLPLAVEALERGDRAEAVSIFKMLYEIRPDDREVTNNLGFCILPEQPEEAAGYLTTAIQTTTSKPLLAMAYLNLSLARYILGDISGAREALASSREHPTDGLFCWMWDLAGIANDEWHLVNYTDGLSEYSDALQELLDAC